MANDALLSATDKEGLLCELYVNAVATISGYLVSKQNLDKDGVDITISAGGEARPKLDIQCKSTFNLDWTNEAANFALPIRNYDLLRCAVQTPRLLVVLDLPKLEADWVVIGPDELILRKCAYWLSLSDAAESSNQTSKTVSLNPNNRFDAGALRLLMEQSRSGTIGNTL
jgi:Domain of unknown function (DUF4365)